MSETRAKLKKEKEEKDKKRFGRKKKSKRQSPSDQQQSLFVFDRNSDEIPIVVEDCLNYLEKDGVNQEGIFRLSGSAEVINNIKAQYVEGKQVDLTKVAREANDVAGLLKLYFREMPEALLTWELYECFLAAIGVPDNDARLECLRKVVELLPTSNRLILSRLMGFLSKVAANQAVTKMGPQNLAIVFSPTLYRPKDEDVNVVMQDSSHANQLIEAFVTNYEHLFVKSARKSVVLPTNDVKFEEFNKTMKRGTLRFAKKFLTEEKQTEIVKAEDTATSPTSASLPPPPFADIPIANNNPNKVAAWDVFQGGQPPVLSTPPPPQVILPKQNHVSAAAAAAALRQRTPEPLRKLSTPEPVKPRSYTANSSSLPLPPPPLVIPNGSSALAPPPSLVTPPMLSPSSLSGLSSNNNRNSTEPVEEMSAKHLVEKLMEGKNVFVMNYLDTLSVQKRKKVVDEMSVFLDQHAA